MAGEVTEVSRKLLYEDEMGCNIVTVKAEEA